MAYDQNILQAVRERLAAVHDVEEKKMFGSIGFMVNGKLCIGVGEHKGHSMMVRVGPSAYAEALTKKGASPTIMRNREMKGYVSLSKDAFATAEDMGYWVDLALRFNKSLL